MAQYFQIIDLYSGESVYWIGKLIERYLGSHRYLVNLLYKPDLPTSPLTETRARQVARNHTQAAKPVVYV